MISTQRETDDEDHLCYKSFANRERDLSLVGGNRRFRKLKGENNVQASSNIAKMLPADEILAHKFSFSLNCYCRLFLACAEVLRVSSSFFYTGYFLLC